MSKINKILFFSFISFYSQFLFSMECGKFKAVYNDQLEQQQFLLDACISKNKGTYFLSSQDCKVHSSCPLVQELKESPLVNPNQIYNQAGSPGFNLCHLYRWSPKTVHIQISKVSRAFVLCSPDEDYNTFMNADGLLKYYLDILDRQPNSKKPKRNSTKKKINKKSQ